MRLQTGYRKNKTKQNLTKIQSFEGGQKAKTEAVCYPLNREEGGELWEGNIPWSVKTGGLPEQQRG